MQCDVYVASFGKVSLQERLEIVRDLWHHGIRADFQYNDGSVLTQEDLVLHCKKASINWIVILKHKSMDSKTMHQSGDIVKVKDVLRKTETDVPRADLAMWLTSEIGEQIRIDHTLSGAKIRNKHELKGKEVVEAGMFRERRRISSFENLGS